MSYFKSWSHRLRPTSESLAFSWWLDYEGLRWKCSGYLQLGPLEDLQIPLRSSQTLTHHNAVVDWKVLPGAELDRGRTKRRPYQIQTSITSCSAKLTFASPQFRHVLKFSPLYSEISNFPAPWSPRNAQPRVSITPTTPTSGGWPF